MKLHRETRRIDTSAGKMKMLLLRPDKGRELRPGLLWIHGGGYVMGFPAMVYLTMGRALGKHLGAVVLSPDYRRAYRAPYPAALEDCYTALKYLYDRAEELGVDRNRIIVGGESAGGGLAAAVCLLARDRGEIPVRLQLPLYPMLDCEDTDSSRDNHAHGWGTRRNHWGWSVYLRDLYGSGQVPPYASPSRNTDYRNLPPCYTYIEDGEPFLDETLAYVQHLREAGVDARADVFHGKTHGFDVMFWTRNARSAKEKLFRETKRLLSACLLLPALMLCLVQPALADPAGRGHVHDWGAPSYTWEEDYSHVTAVRRCRDYQDASCEETETVPATPAKTKDPTCTEYGEMTFTSHAFKNQAFSVQTKVVKSIPPLDHTWKELSYAWAPDNSTVTGTRVCERCTVTDTETVATEIDSYTVPPTCESGGVATLRTKQFSKETFIQQKKCNVPVPALGHDWAAPSYTWAADNSTVTAVRLCRRDASHPEQETVPATFRMVKPPTWTEEGAGVYTSDAFRNPAFAAQEKTVVIPVLDPTPPPDPPAPATPGPDASPDPDPPSPDPSSPDPAPGPAEIGNAVVSAIRDQDYTGKPVCPRPAVTFEGRPLAEGSDYTLAWQRNVKVGDAEVTLMGINGFTGMKTAAFRIVPKGVSLKPLKSGPKSLSVRWKKGRGIDGYELEYSLKKSFKGARKITVRKAKTTAYELKGLKPKKTYYVRIRTWKKVGRKTYYSPWSRARKKKTRK